MSPESKPPDLAPDAPPNTARGDTTFANQMRGLRQRLGSKQCWVAAVVGCTSACVSLWETGRRVPDLRNFMRLMAALDKAGASSHELTWLRESWRAAKYPGLEGGT